jgi:hypothetical protein
MLRLLTVMNGSAAHGSPPVLALSRPPLCVQRIVQSSGFSEIAPIPACFSEQGESHKRGGASAPQLNGEITMTHETKEQQREPFLVEFFAAHT